MKVSELIKQLQKINQDYDIIVETPHRSSIHTIDDIEAFRRDDVCVLHVTYDLEGIKNPAMHYRA
jgi:hypothetical protein